MPRDRVRQAAAIPYREGPFGGLEVLLISTTGSGAWGIPKGGIKRGSSATETATLETLEEAGVMGVLDDRALGSFRYKKRGRKHDVRVFPLRVDRQLDRWAEERRRSRVWVHISEAPALVGREALKPLLVKLRHRVLCASPSALRRAA